jgi:hypothetical protein
LNVVSPPFTKAAMLDPVAASFATTAISAIASAAVPSILRGFAVAPMTGLIAGAEFHAQSRPPKMLTLECVAFSAMSSK